MQRAEYECSWLYEEKMMSQKQKKRTYYLNKTNRFPEHQDPHQIRDRFRKYVVDANSDDDIKKSAAQEDACKELEYFVIYMINRKFSTYIKKDPIFFEDLLQAGRLGIIQSLPKYDPEKSMPTTYFYIAIMHEMTTLVNGIKHNTKSNTAALKRKIKEVDEEYAKYGRTPALHDYIYDIGCSFNCIMDALVQMKAGNVMTSIDDPDNARSIGQLAGGIRLEEIIISKIGASRIIQLAREIEQDEAIVQCFIESSEGMADTAQLAERYHRSPSEITNGILNLKNCLKGHKDIRKLYPERFQAKRSRLPGGFCDYLG